MIITLIISNIQTIPMFKSYVFVVIYGTRYDQSKYFWYYRPSIIDSFTWRRIIERISNIPKHILYDLWWKKVIKKNMVFDISTQLLTFYASTSTFVIEKQPNDYITFPYTFITIYVFICINKDNTKYRRDRYYMAN